MHGEQLPTATGSTRVRRTGLTLGLVLLSSGLVVGAAPVPAADACAQGRQQGPGGHSYQLICTPRSFSQAKAAAVRAGGHLVTIGTAAENCPEIGAVVQLDPVGRVGGFEPSGNGVSMRQHLERLLGQLPDRYPELARALKARIAPGGGLGLSADRTFITRYPDFMHGADGDYCDTRDASVYFQANWDRATWTWLSLAAAQLNQRVRRAASTFGWHAVAAAAIGPRGWCNESSSLFVGIGDAILSWNLDGPFHPIAEAHLMARDAHVPLVCKRLYTKDDCTGDPR